VGARALASLLYGVRQHDPAVIAMAPLVLAAIALLACVGPGCLTVLGKSAGLWICGGQVANLQAGCQPAPRR
jgi:hypothetical protein